jgi:hypothetical protein
MKLLTFRSHQTVAFAEQERPSGASYRLDEVMLLAPVPRPRSIRDSMAFERHVIQCMRAIVSKRWAPVVGFDAWLERVWGQSFIRPPKVWYERPVYYRGNPASVVGPEADVRWPSYTERLDYTGNALGPYLVTPDEVPDPHNLTMVSRVNGEEWSRGNSRQMGYRWEELLAFISRDETLYPGDFIGSGTMGNGCGLELNRWLRPGDVVELEVERLDVLRNRVVRSSG